MSVQPAAQPGSCCSTASARTPGTRGRLVGALERMESGGTLRILEALFISKDAETGELVAVDLHSRGAGSLVSPLPARRA
jgi:hypothetical protein